jgi:SAM-dependent methyltransferase
VSGNASANAAQIEYWNSRAGQRWAQWQQTIDRAMSELTAALIDFAGPRAGERVLDVGCGCGSTGLLLSQSVGPAGRVAGIDVSAPMLEVARRRAEQAQAPIGFALADAALQAFAADYDLLFSRFGVMFFDAPVAAFRNLRQALRPGGRLVFLCWRPLAQNEWAAVPLAAGRPYLPAQATADPLAPGPFALADRDRINAILDDAGFAAIEIVPLDADFWMGDSLDQAVIQALTIGPLAAATAELGESARVQVRAAVGAALACRLTPRGVLAGAACWLVRARPA